MPLESGSFITALNASNPAHTDGLSQADSHMRLIKSVLLATFPNLNAAVNATPAQLNQLAAGGVFALPSDGTLAAPALSYVSEPGLGLYRPSAGHLAVAGKLVGNGAKAPGEWAQFAYIPPTTAMASGGTATGTEAYVETDGNVYPVTTFPDLYAAIGNTYGGTPGVNYAVPNTTNTGRFLRGRSAAAAVGVSQANQLGSHTHTGTVDSAGSHAHTATDAGHQHTNDEYRNGAQAAGGTGSHNLIDQDAGTTGVGSHIGFASVILSADGAHTHTFTSAATGGTETRPEAMVVVLALKT